MRVQRVITKKDCRFPMRKKGAHKGQHGRLLIVGGSERFVGAPILAAKAAFRAGVDIVEVAAPAKVAWAVNCNDASIITHKLRCTAFSKRQVAAVLVLARKADAVLVGNGLGRNPQQKSFVYELLKKLDKPVVIDADALHATFLSKVRSRSVICTPHAKEYEALMRNNQGVRLKEGQVILRKGPTDRIITSTKTLLNRTGCPEMAVAGTGDVLAGLAAGYLAQHLSPLQAASSAAYRNGKAGGKARRNHGNFTAEELIGCL